MGAVKLNYKEYGDGEECLIILHGLLGMLDNWHTLSTRYAEKFKVYTLDQRDHGRSPHTDELSYPLMVEDLLLFIDNMNLKKVNLMGHSMGGKTAMFFASKYPERIKKLIIVDMFPFRGSGDHNDIFEALKRMDIDSVNSRKEADESLSVYINNPAIRQFLLKNIDRLPEGGYAWKMNLKTIVESYDNIKDSVPSGTINLPTLFIKGTKSSYIKIDDFDEYQLLFPQAKLSVVEDAGHWVHAENPKDFFKVSTEFLS